MKLNRIYSVVAMLGVVMMALTIAGCGTKTVSVADVTYKDMPLQIHNDANVTALNKATVTPTLTGQVAYAVKVGDQVQQGQVLATVDTSALQQQLASLQGQLAQVSAQSYATSVTTTTAASVDSAQLAQAQKMREAGMITQKEYDRIVERSQPQTTTVTTGGGGGGANTAAIEAQIAQVSAQMAASTIVAPIAGTVTAIYNEDRQMAIADRPFMMIQQSTPMVASLSNVKAKMLTVPSKAVRENQDGKYVYVLTENNTVDVRVVEVGMTEDDDVAIISGLNEGDKVITSDGTFELGESVKL